MGSKGSFLTDAAPPVWSRRAIMMAYPSGLPCDHLLATLPFVPGGFPR
jgi:hypothetical protein